MTGGASGPVLVAVLAGLAGGVQAARPGVINATILSFTPVEKPGSKVMLLVAVYCAGPPVAGRLWMKVFARPVPAGQDNPVLSATRSTVLSIVTAWAAATLSAAPLN